ncbi:MAG: DUF1917 domain-containing protein [Candidatus Micrarchaeaceae archaeon]
MQGRLKSGKWCIYINRQHIDTVWNSIKNATEKGEIGNDSKVATKLTSDKDNDRGSHVICVFTYDWMDKKDVMRVRNQLKKLGIVRKIPHKADEDTFAGKYKYTMKSKSKYYV